MKQLSKENIIRILSIVILLSFFACKKSEPKETQKLETLESLSDFVCGSTAISDSISKFKNWKLLSCTKQKVGKNSVITISAVCTPFYVSNDFDYYYKSINGINVIFCDFSKSLTNKNNRKGLNELVRNKIVKIGHSKRLCCQMPTYYFAFCTENPKEIVCYNNVMLDKKREGNYKLKKYRAPEFDFFPMCNE